jgi:hypothetical protein
MNIFAQLCLRNLETPLRLLAECTWTMQVWSKLAQLCHQPSLNAPASNEPRSIQEWLQACTAGAGAQRS